MQYHEGVACGSVGLVFCAWWRRVVTVSEVCCHSAVSCVVLVVLQTSCICSGCRCISAVFVVAVVYKNSVLPPGATVVCCICGICG